MTAARTRLCRNPSGAPLRVCHYRLRPRGGALPGSGAVKRLEWRFADPAAVAGPELARQRAFREVRDQLAARIRLFLDHVE